MEVKFDEEVSLREMVAIFMLFTQALTVMQNADACRFTYSRR